jgi:formyltetrahydrofolate deformylase
LWLVRMSRRLLVTCPDRPGIVAGVSRCLYDHGANIVESQQYSTNPVGGSFFLLVEFHLACLAGRMAQLEQGLSALAEKFAMTWRMTRAADRKRMAIFVSRSDHALRELRWRVESGELNADITMVISNHRATAELVTSWGIPFCYVPISADTRAEAEAAQLKLLDGEVDFVVLARCRRQSAPGGRRPRREADRRHRALCDRRPGCRPDHRAGHRAGRSPLLGG